ncbi:DUF262 domain-containing protein [Flavobacterium luteum]|uniref:DUF262 domain-containing protein n=1 Tax=Flavobacterium luteum TaxID=2026654 RepID=A0A7J5AB49_9FLAO|nr:DUF262 domain-containing protein [Flavobacterium luteum]KAB1154792.1 DUF262 domain-containing protein [Flavobacterium luteum]
MENNNTLETQSGERLTFFQLFDEKEYHIEIPIIQRDYAQGRKASFEVRDLFLDALYNYLEENKKHRDLDFVYGSLIDNDNKNDIKFIPLDGQQRLTTLFLLHWYLANKDGQLDLFKDKLQKGNKSKFTYETRTSSREFCDALLLNDIELEELLPPDKNQKNSLSKTIKDSSWYFLSWGNDPTIKSMLVMLDAIHNKFNNADNFFDRLISPDNPVITFQFLNLKEFKLTDDLYIKMNARGKSLTDFENFKAKFEQHIKDLEFKTAPKFKLLFNDIEKKVTVQEYFSHKIDTDWANLFWNYRDPIKNIYDDQLMNFIRAFAINHLAAKPNEDFDLTNLKYLLDRQNDNISFQKYIELKCFDEKFILELIKILDYLKNEDNTIRLYLKSSQYYDETDTFINIVNNSFKDAAYSYRIKFYAFCQYLNKFETTVGLEEWLRVISNLTENTAPYNNETEFRRSIRAVEYLLQIANTIITNLSLDTLKVDGFNEYQVKEEVIKAKLILKDDNWAKLIYNTEYELKYFSCQLTFILYFSGIEDVISNINNWTTKENDELFNSFKKYVTIAKGVFSSGGLRKFNNHLWQRALLSKGNYLISEGSNSSFLINNDRDISWKRLLLADKDGGKPKRIFVKQVFDDIDFNILDVEKGLKAIVANSLKTVTGWRNKFIKTPSLFNFLGAKQYIRYKSDNEIYLLAGERMSGSHTELFTYSYFLENLENKSFPPFNKCAYYAISGEADEPCIYLKDWLFKKSNYELDITYDTVNKKYNLSFFYVKSKTFDTEIVEILSSNDFIKSSDYEAYDLLLSEKDLQKSLIKLCNEFQLLNDSTNE